MIVSNKTKENLFLDMETDPEKSAELACYNIGKCLFDEDEQQDRDLQDKMVQARLLLI